MRKLTRQTTESNFPDFLASTLSHAVAKPFACDVKPAKMEQHLLITCSTEGRKNTTTGNILDCDQFNVLLACIIFSCILLTAF